MLAPHDHNFHSHQGSGQLPLNPVKLQCINISAVRFEICDRNSRSKKLLQNMSHRKRICSFLIDPFNDILFNFRWQRSQSLPWPLSMTVKLTLLANKASRNQNWLGGYATSFWRLDVEFLFPLNYLLACPWIYMTALKVSRKCGQQKSVDPSDLASGPPLAMHTHIYSLCLV